jgi:hypothetical protein
MFGRIGLTIIAILSLATSPAVAGRWDIAFDGGFMRCVIDLDAQNSTVAAKVYDAKPGGTYAIAEDLIVVNAADMYYLVQGTITSGDFKVGMGELHFTVGDRFYLLVSKYSDDILLVLVNSKFQWTRKLHTF